MRNEYEEDSDLFTALLGMTASQAQQSGGDYLKD